MKRSSSPTSILALLGSLLLAAAASAPAEEATVLTRVHLLVGFPSAESGDGPGTRFAPGTVLPLEEPEGLGQGEPMEGSSGEAESPLDLGASLRRAAGLESVDSRYELVRPFTVGQETPLPPPSSSSEISLFATLQEVTGELASYRIRSSSGDRVIADSQVAVKRGGRAVVGGLDGERAPDVLIVLEPLTEEEAGRVAWLSRGYTPPRSLSKTRPQYTPEAKENRLEGMVILQTVIGKDGRVDDVNVIQGLPDGLTEAAETAVRAWLFEPALDADGEPVAVYYNLSINFRLE